jgi:hypothetical protein
MEVVMPLHGTANGGGNFDRKFQDDFGALKQLIQALEEKMSGFGIPDYLQTAVLNDLYRNRNEEATEGLTFLELFQRLGPREKRSDIVIAFIGGTYLERRIPHEYRRYYHLNMELAQRFARLRLRQHSSRRGASFASGGGPGVAMHGPLYCLSATRAQLDDCESKCISIPSGLGDERPNPHADPNWKTSRQQDLNLRELLLILLADVVIAYPGFLGMLFELGLVFFINYVSGASDISAPKLPLIIVDMKANADLGCEFRGSQATFFSPILDDFVYNAELFGLTKSRSGLSSAFRVFVEDPLAPDKIVGWISNELGLNGFEDEELPAEGETLH